MKTNNFAAPVLYDIGLTEPSHHIILSEIKLHSVLLHVHDQILCKTNKPQICNANHFHTKMKKQTTRRPPNSTARMLAL
jgi:hypothetical protein